MNRPVLLTTLILALLTTLTLVSAQTPKLWTVDEFYNPTTDFAVGETIYLNVMGFLPYAVRRYTVTKDGKEIVNRQFQLNKFGMIERYPIYENCDLETGSYAIELLCLPGGFPPRNLCCGGSGGSSQGGQSEGNSSQEPEELPEFSTTAGIIAISASLGAFELIRRKRIRA